MLRNNKLIFQTNVLNICVILTFLLMFGHAKTSQLPFYYAVLALLIGFESIHILNRRNIKLSMYKIVWKYLIWFTLFTVLCFLNISRAIIPELAKENFGFIWKDCVLLFLIIYWYVNKDKEHLLFNYYLIASIYMTIRTIATFMINYNMDETLNTLGIQFNSIALLASIGGVLSFYYMYINKKKEYGIPFLFCCICVLITSSRKSLLLLVGGIVILLLFYGNLSKRIKNLFVIIIGLIIGLILMENVPGLYERFGSRMKELLEFFQGNSSSSSVSIRERLLFYKTASDLFAKNIWFGNGLMSCYSSLLLSGSRHVGYAHNNYMEIASAMGIVGLITYYWIYVVLIVKGIKSYKKIKKNEGLAYLTVLILFLFIQIGQVVYYHNYFLIVVVLLGLGLEQSIIDLERVTKT